MKIKIAEAGIGPFVAADLETTGFSFKRGERIIEIGAVLVENGEATGEFHSLIKTGRRISRGARSVHGIGEEDLASAPPAAAVIPAFREFVGERPLVAHNAVFDVSFLRYEYARLGLGFNHRSYCTLRLSRRTLPHLHRHDLVSVYTCLFNGLPAGVALHRALDDARLVADIWMELIRKRHEQGR